MKETLLRPTIGNSKWSHLHSPSSLLSEVCFTTSHSTTVPQSSPNTVTCHVIIRRYKLISSRQHLLLFSAHIFCAMFKWCTLLSTRVLRQDLSCTVLKTVQHCFETVMLKSCIPFQNLAWHVKIHNVTITLCWLIKDHMSWWITSYHPPIQGVASQKKKIDAYTILYFVYLMHCFLHLFYPTLRHSPGSAIFKQPSFALISWC